MAPEVLPRLERLAAAAPERALGRVDPFVQSDGRRVLEALAADAAAARVLVGVPVQMVLLEVHLQLESDVACVAAVRPRLAVF